MSDGRIADALRRGADDALDRIFESYAPELYDYCLTFFADEAAAADALHEAMLVAASWGRYLVNRGHLRPWLYALARNECLRILRRGSKPSLIGIDAPAPATPHRGRTDPILREVTDLVNRHGFVVHEIALILGVTQRRARALCLRSASVLSRDHRAGSGISEQARPAPPNELRHRVLTSAAMPSRVAYRGELAQPRLRSGFPVPLEYAAGYRHRRAMTRVAAAAAMLAGLSLAVAIPAVSRQSVLGLVENTSPINENPPDNGSQNPGPDSSPSQRWEPQPLPSADSGLVNAGLRRGPISGPGSKCIDVRSSATADGTPINLFSCNATKAQEWTILADGTIRAFDKCMGATGENGAPVQLFSCDDDPALRWEILADGGLRNGEAGQCLETPGARIENFTVLTVGDCRGDENQVWRLPV